MDEYYFTLAEVLRERLDLIADHQLRGQNPTAHLERLKRPNRCARGHSRKPDGAVCQLHRVNLRNDDTDPLRLVRLGVGRRMARWTLPCLRVTGRRSWNFAEHLSQWTF